MIQFSVIIPVYNVEKYLNECIESVVNQTYKRLEIILVDDGSTDTSPALCDEWTETDTRIKVIHKANGGSSSARNLGIKAATGEYILFLDSDDYWCDNQFLEKIYNLLIEEQSNLVCFGYAEYFDSDKRVGKKITYSMDGDNKQGNELLQELIKSGFYVSSAWTKVVKRDLLILNNLFFEEGVTSEDIEWSAKLLLLSKCISVLPDAVVMYRQREGSIVHNIKPDNLKMLFNIIVRCINLAESIQDERLKMLYLNYVSYQFATLFLNMGRCSSKDGVSELIEDAKQYSWILDYHLNKKVKMVWLLKRIIGYKLTSKVLIKYGKG